MGDGWLEGGYRSCTVPSYDRKTRLTRRICSSTLDPIYIVLVDTSRGFTGTSVMTQALMKDDDPEKVAGEIIPGYFCEHDEFPM